MARFSLSCSLAFPLLSYFSMCSSRFNQSRKIAETTNETKRVNFRVVYDKHASSIEQWSSERKILDMPTTWYFIASQHKPTCTQLPVERFEFSNSFWIILSNYRICVCPRVHACIPMTKRIYLSRKGSSVQASKTLDTCTTIQSDDVPDNRSELINFRRTFPINFHGKQLINEGCIIERSQDSRTRPWNSRRTTIPRIFDNAKF